MGGFAFFVLFFVVMFLLYFVVGFSYQWWRGASGRQLIPNYTFWAELPGHCKSCFLYIWHGCRPANSYEAI